MFRRTAAAGAFLVLAAGSASAQSIVRPVPRVATHELASLSITPDLGQGPGSTWEMIGPQPDSASASDGVTAALQGRLWLQPDADFSDTAGTVATQRAGWDVVVGRRTESGLLLAVGLESEASFYDFGGTLGLVPGAPDPFNDLYSTRLGTTLYSPLSKRLDLFNGVELTLAGEDNVDPFDGLTVGGSTGLAYRADDDFELSFGLAAASRLEDDAYLLPFIGIDWRVAEGTRLVAEGPEVRLEQRLTDTATLTLSAEYEIRQFRLNSGGVLDDGAFRDEQIDLGASLAWQPTARTRVEFGAGYTVWRELTFLGNDGSSLGQSETEPAPYGALTISLTF
ncbi:DUF6268 family outer membrane beta-barrel protein [Engelhardtia mirabilis]|uniref:DUF6268 domain-containing protein n=1 Tax=Engelhardtia mirabilis TaxID=2528011 RepID=A0A518BJG4_9BACT|nr:hypothetical protein Pla133_22050 [Planctomycetes bacterium Pla133]QDV01454.1 hypothetical protein Pla86_22050 [Planctomycetes bacterium Pla86]